jgi:hypothetical protein
VCSEGWAGGTKVFKIEKEKKVEKKVKDQRGDGNLK